MEHDGADGTVHDLASIEIGEDIARVAPGGDGVLAKQPLTKGVDAACSAIDDVVPALAGVAVPVIEDVVKAAKARAKAAALRPSKGDKRFSGKSPGFGSLLELCGPKESNLHLAAKEFDKVHVFTVTKELDLLNPETENALINTIKRYPGVSVHASLPCTVWCLRQHINVSTLGLSLIHI